MTTRLLTTSPLNLLIVVAISAVAACASAARPAALPPAAVGAGRMGASATGTRTPSLPNDIHWARNSAEHRAIFHEVYRAASERLATLISGHPRGSWGVILDADETVLDNSDYQRSRAAAGGRFDAISWNVWVMQGRAPALPGAIPFTALVHQLGGRVVIVTNRDDSQCSITRANLAGDGILADLVLCRTTTSDKNPRFESVQHGTAASGLPALAVLEWLGDNIQDFPMLDQSSRADDSDAAFSRFGDSYFAFPNPMYGSWEANPSQ